MEMRAQGEVSGQAVLWCLPWSLLKWNRRLPAFRFSPEKNPLEKNKGILKPILSAVTMPVLI
jgi:hypothetical protein